MNEQPETHNDPRETLAALIAAKGWTMDSAPIAKRSHDFGMDADAGHYAFTLRAGRHEYQGEYSVGLWHLTDWAGKHLPGIGDGFRAWTPADFRAPRWPRGAGLSVHQAECLPAIRRAYRPDIVDVVGSLLMDVSGWSPECTFREWLADCGMDWKNPANALECFEVIRREAAFIFRALSNEAERAQWLEVAWGL